MIFSYKEYRRLAKYRLRKISTKKEDIDYLVDIMVASDLRFNGTGNRDAFRCVNINYGIKHILRRKKQSSYIPDRPDRKQIDPKDYIEISEIFDFVASMSDNESKSFTMYYLYGYTKRDIANYLDLSEQYVGRIINNVTKKVRHKYG